MGNQTENSNGKKLQRIIDNNSLIPISTKAHYGLWTRVNRNNTEERSVIDYIITTETIERNTTSLIIDKEGTLRIKGKKESDHNTILMAIKVNNPRKREYITKWKLENKEGWNQFNKKIKEKNNQSELSKRDYEDTERTIIKTMEETVGRQKTRVDKPPIPKSDEIKTAKNARKIAKKEFQGACRSGTQQEKEKTKIAYMGTQEIVRSLIEQHMEKQTEKRIKKLTEKAKIDPNIIWQARKKAQATNSMEYNTITEDNITLTEPEETLEYVAEYFQNLYQAREGEPEYHKSTEEIKVAVEQAVRNNNTKPEQGEEPITPKEMNNAIKRLKRKKSLGPDKIPNEVFIEADQETRHILCNIFNKIHKAENIPPSWREGEILRLYKGKGKKGKCSNERGITLASNAGKVYERIVNERIKKHVVITGSQAGGTPGNATCDHLITLKQTIHETRKKGKTAYVIFLDVQKAYDKAWLDAILYALHKNGIQGKNLKTCQEAKLKPNSKNPNQIWPNGTDKDQGQHKTRRSTVSHRICNTNGWNRQRTTKQKPGHRNRPRCNNRLPTMDGRCMPNPPRQKQAPEDAGHNKPYSQEIPHRIWSRQMQGSENRQRPKKLPST